MDQSKLVVQMLKQRLRLFGRCTCTRFGQESCSSRGVDIAERCEYCQDEAVMVWLIALRDENRVLHGRIERLTLVRQISDEGRPQH